MKKIITLLVMLVMLVSSTFIINANDAETIISDDGRLPFEDVREDYWFTNAVNFCYANGIVNGMNEYTFGFSSQLTRGQFVVMLANLEGVDTSLYSVDEFVDVKPEYWYYGAVSWAYEEGIVAGMSDDKFAASATISRSMISAMMQRYMKNTYSVTVDENCLNRFRDSHRVPAWAGDSVKYAVSAELITGMSEDELDPLGGVTRAQAAVILKNFYEKYYRASCEHIFTDATCTEAETCELCGMKKGLAKGHSLTEYDCTTGGVCTVCESEVEASKILHNFADATCTSPRICVRCSLIRGKSKPHNFEAATCIKLKTCIDCGATEGDYAAHKWQAATCTEAKKCTVCNAAEGNALGHKWKAATCDTPETCTVCRVTRGNALGHKWQAATCTTRKTCTVCRKTDGLPLGHSEYDSNGKCPRCGMACPYDRIVYALKTKGTYDKETNTYYKLNTYWKGAYCHVQLSYDATTADLTLSFIYEYDDGAYDMTVITLPKKGKTINFGYLYIDRNDTPIIAASGEFYAHDFNTDFVMPFSVYQGSEANRVPTRKNINYELDLALEYGDTMISNMCGADFFEFGFIYY